MVKPRLYHESSTLSAGVFGQGKTNIHFIDTQRPKVNSKTYINLLHKHLLPDRWTLYPQNNYIFQQDGASSHTSRASIDYLTENTNQFIEKDEWPPQSADCNPMDYAIWDMLSERVKCMLAANTQIYRTKTGTKNLKSLAGDKSHRNSG